MRWKLSGLIPMHPNSNQPISNTSERNNLTNPNSSATSTSSFPSTSGIHTHSSVDPNLLAHPTSSSPKKFTTIPASNSIAPVQSSFHQSYPTSNLNTTPFPTNLRDSHLPPCRPPLSNENELTMALLPLTLPANTIQLGLPTDPLINDPSKPFLKNAPTTFYSSMPHFSSPEGHPTYFYSQTCLPTCYDPIHSPHPTFFPTNCMVPNSLMANTEKNNKLLGLAAQLPHEILLRIFSYLLPHIELSDPFMDDERGSGFLTSMALPSSTFSQTSFPPSVSMNSPTTDPSETDMDIDTPLNSSSPSSSFAPSMSRTSLSLGNLMQSHLLPTPTTSPTRPFPLSSSPNMYSPTVSSPASAVLPYTTLPPPATTSLETSSSPTVLWPQARPHYRYLYPCLFVCRSWYYAAIYYLHSDPVLENACDFVQWLACLEACAQTLSRMEPAASQESLRPSFLPPGLAGFAQTKTLRFEHSNLVRTQHLSYRIPVKGSLPSPNMYIRDDHINRIAQTFHILKPHILHLHLSNCAHITDVAIIHLITSVSSSLRTLDVTNCRHIKDVTVRTISRLCDQLQSLALRGCGKVGDASLKELAHFLGPQLIKLDVAGCMRINDPGLDLLSKFSGNYTSSPWESLRASANTSSAASLLLNKTLLPPRPDGRIGGMLKSLSIPGIRRQSRGGLVNFLQEIVQVHPHLTELEFSIPPPPSTSTKSIFSWSHILFPSLQNLTSLTIRDCEFLDDANLEPIAHHCRQLQHLILFNVVNMTEVSFSVIVQSLTQLRTLVIRGARFLTDAIVAPLLHAECASKLEKLDFTDCFELGDETLFMLSTLWIFPPTSTHSSTLVPVFGQLQHVAIENCRRISFRGVLGLIKALLPYKLGSRGFQLASLNRPFLSFHVSGAWEGVTQKAMVAYRERPGSPTITKEIHLATLAVRGLLRDEFDIGPIGSGGASMLWSILPNHQGRPPVTWFCRFARSSLKHVAQSYAWVPIPLRCQWAKPCSQLPSIPGLVFTVSQIPGMYIAYQQPPTPPPAPSSTTTTPMSQ